MKRFTGIALMILLSIGILTGCGQSYDAEVSTVFVQKDGKIVSTDVEAFEEDRYDKEGLKTYVENAIADYNGGDTEAVVMKSLTVEEGNAILILEYASASDYAAFNGIELFTGSIADALAAGYSFDVEFASVEGGNASACSVNDFLGSKDLKVAIIKGNIDVHVDGRVAYVSTANTSYVDAGTIRIQEGTSLLGQPAKSTQDTEALPGATEGTEAVEAAVPQVGENGDGGAVSEDDLLMDTEEPEKVEFTFDDEEHVKDEEPGEFGEVYTYIIYR